MSRVESRRSSFALLLLPALFLHFLLTACAGYGTGTGNPIQDYGSGSDPDLDTQAALLTASICQQLTLCHTNLGIATCKTEIASHNGMGVRVGAPDHLSNLSTIRMAEKTGDLVADPAAGLSCRRSIERLACDDPLVVRAYDPQSADPFADAPNLLGADCSGIY